MEIARLEQVALMVMRDHRLGLALAPETHGLDLYGPRMLPLAFPGAPYVPGGGARDQALSLSGAIYGQPATSLPTVWTYGPSPRHAIDRERAVEPATAPFLRLTRMLPRDSATTAGPRLVAIEVYRAELAGDLLLDPRVIAGVIWLPFAALRALIPGARVGDLLRQAGVQAQLADGVSLPEEGVLYLPADYGERYLLRLAAKYSESALFQAFTDS